MHTLREALVATLLVVAGCTSAGTGSPAAELDGEAVATVEHEVEVAYLRSWDVYAKALRSLSTDGLEESFTGPALESTIAEVNRLRSAGTPVQVLVDHGTSIEVREGAATVRDSLVNHSVLLDRDTGMPVEADPRSPHVFTYNLERNGDQWRVIYIAQGS